MPPEAIIDRPYHAQPLLHTPFHARQRSASTMDRFLPWAGYSTVDVFTNVEQEYFAIRNACSVYDLTPMVKYAIEGPQAEAYLNRLVTRDLRKLRPGRVAYAVWCNDEGRVIEDGTVFRLAPDRFRLCTAERQLDWLLDSAIGFDVRVAEVTETIAALSLQGPTSCAVLKSLGCAGVEHLAPFSITDFPLPGSTLMISRTGFTGDLGYELWMRPEIAEAVWDGLMAAGAVLGIRPVGSAALNLARIEAGFVMPNMDFVPAETAVRLRRDRTPFELGLGWLVSFDKPHFNGRRALGKAGAAHPPQMLVGLDVEGKEPAVDALLYADRACRREIGAVTSAIWSPTCKRNIALGFIERHLASIGSSVWAELYLCRELRWERRVVRARVVERPFFAPRRRRQTPAPDF